MRCPVLLTVELNEVHEMLLQKCVGEWRWEDVVSLWLYRAVCVYCWQSRLQEDGAGRRNAACQWSEQERRPHHRVQRWLSSPADSWQKESYPQSSSALNWPSHIPAWNFRRTLFFFLGGRGKVKNGCLQTLRGYDRSSSASKTDRSMLLPQKTVNSLYAASPSKISLKNVPILYKRNAGHGFTGLHASVTICAG